jgi:hypothetical protein
MVTDLENRFIAFRFVHLEAYARVLGVPTGVLLLVSKYSQTSNPGRDFEELRALLTALLAICKEGRLSSLSIHDLIPLKGIVSFTPPQEPMNAMSRPRDEDHLSETQLELFSIRPMGPNAS